MLMWCVAAGVVVLCALLGVPVHYARRTADAAELASARLKYLEGVFTGLAADVDALRELKVQESDYPMIHPDGPGGAQPH